ncbi:MAG: serine/threonine-protein kinase [Rhodospirillaceae bacterium]
MAGAAGPGAGDPGEDVVLCETPADFDGLAARAMIAAVLRPYIEAAAVTPGELLYGSHQLKALLDQRPVVEAALWRVATLQARVAGQDAQVRRAALQAAVDGLIRRSRATEAALAAASGHRSATAAYLAGQVSSSVRLGPALVRAVVALDLAGRTGWPAKFEYLFGLVWQRADEPLWLAVDELFGDLLALPAATREMLPPRMAPGAVMLRLLEMIQGRITPESGQQNRLANLSPLFRQNHLPAARVAILDRIRRQLRSADALATGQPGPEAEALGLLVEGLMTTEGVAGGPAMAEALTRRCARRFDEGGVRAVRRAVATIAGSLAELPARLHYLAAVATEDLSPVLGEAAADALEAALAGDAALEALIFGSADVAAARAALMRAVAAVEACALPAAVRRRLSVWVDHAADDYAVSGMLLARLASFEPTMARQAWRLAELVFSEWISEPRALALVRQRLLTLQRLPGFNDEILAQKAVPGGGGLDPQRLRQLFERLKPPSEDVATLAAPPPSPRTPPVVMLSSDLTMTLAQDTIADTVTMTTPARPAVPVPARPAAVVNRAAAPAAVPAVPRPPAAGDGRCPNCFGRSTANAACPECGYLAGVTAYPPILLPPGTWLLDRYRTGRLLGQGGFGATYLGWDDRLQIRVAVKEYFPTHLVARQSAGPGMTPYSAEHGRNFAKGITKFLEEARVLARLRDIREIVAVQDYFEANGTAYLVMELLQGRTMKAYIAEEGGRIDSRKALSILLPIMKALHSIHEQGMVHRDISPDNIFMPAGGGAKLLDFGAARQSAGEGGASLTVILKPGFAPPEQYFSDSRQGPWTDIYALAASLYCAITGRPPKDSTRRLQEDTLQPPSALGVTIAPELERVLMTALALRRQERYQSMREMISALAKAG